MGDKSADKRAEIVSKSEKRELGYINGYASKAEFQSVFDRAITTQHLIVEGVSSDWKDLNIAHSKSVRDGVSIEIGEGKHKLVVTPSIDGQCVGHMLVALG